MYGPIALAIVVDALNLTYKSRQDNRNHTEEEPGKPTPADRRGSRADHHVVVSRQRQQSFRAESKVRP
jgi:hypothetical protein